MESNVMKKIIIFRFDRHPRICQNHLNLIKRLNPHTLIYGIYGGVEKDFQKYKKHLGLYFENLYCIKNKSSDWKWKNFDLALRDWYKDFGYNVDFDMAYIIEWDLIITDSIDNAYKHIGKNEVGLTGLTDLSNISNRWSWVTVEPEKSQWISLLSFVKKKYGYLKKPFASLGPGLCIPKIFLEKYSKTEVPELVHDEIRVPLFAQIFGLTCKDTGFYKKWYSREESVFFNCHRLLINIEIIKKEIKKRNGRKAFHPFRGFLDI